ncbi:MAG: hypothetical protein ACHQ2Z_10525 [Elusimicrobiota bacterium]
MKTKDLVAAIFLALCPAGAAASVVTLKDGSVLRGTVVGQTADGLELSTPDGTLHIGLDRLARIDYAEPPPLALPLGELAAPKAAAAAPARPRSRLFAAGVGLIEPVSRIDFHPIGGGAADDGDLGVQLGAQYFCYLSPQIAAGLDVDYFDRTGTLSERLYPSAEASVSGETWMMLAAVRVTLADLNGARPFVLLGAGGGWNTTTIDVRPSAWPDTGTHETRRLIDDSSLVPAASVRLGLDLDVVEPGTLIFETGWTGLASARYGATPQGQALGLSGVSGPLNILSFTVRYGWRL